MAAGGVHAAGESFVAPLAARGAFESVRTDISSQEAAAKPTALLCHGPVVVVSTLDDAPAFRKALEEGDDAGAADLARDWIYSGYRMTVFSASEEKIAEEQVLKGELFFDMEKALRSAGGDVSVTDKNFASNVVVDRELITGQNPASDQAMADALIEALDRAAA